MQNTLTIGNAAIRTALAEIVARKSIERFNVRGNDRCAHECGRAAEKVAAIQ